MKQTHKQKLRMARKMMSSKEISEHIPVFLSDAWVNRNKSRRKKLEK